jgi:predicted acyl esterase
VVASSADQGLHLRGALEAFRRIASRQKWLLVHGRKKWETFHRPASVEKQRAFFDHFLKGVENGVPRWPKVQLEVRSRYGAGRLRAEREWPPARTRYRKLFIDARSRALRAAPVRAASRARYETAGDESRCPAAYRQERAQFDMRFPRRSSSPCT